MLGEVARRFGHPPFAGEILAGLLLGQTVLGHLAPGAFDALFPNDELQRGMFRVTAEIGILFLLLVVGLEVNVASAWRMRKQTVAVAVSGVVVPLALGTGAAWLMYDAWAEVPTSRMAFALLVGAGVSITAITVVARLLFDLSIVKSHLGLFLVSAMAINELLGWLVLAVVLGLLGSGEAGEFDAWHVAMLTGAIVTFSALALTLGRRLVTRVLAWLSNRDLARPEIPLSFVVCLGLLGGVVTAALGIHPVFGFLIAGLTAGDPRALSEHTRSAIERMVEAVFVPLFFAGICLHVDFASNFDLGMVVWVTVLSVVGKFVGAGMGTLLVRMPKLDRLPIAVAHIPGGPMGVLLATVAKEAGVIGPRMFVAIVIASIVSALMVGPLFAAALRRNRPAGVLRFFSAQGILPKLNANTRAQALEVLSRAAADLPGSPPEAEILEAIRQREATMGTSIGHGMAVPHGRFPNLDRARVIVSVAREGVDWDAADNEPVQLVFLILMPTQQADESIAIFAALARAFEDSEARREVVQAEGAAEIWTSLQRHLSAAEGEP